MGNSDSSLKKIELSPPERQKPPPLKTPGVIDFVAAQSYCLSVGIDKQTDPSFEHKSLSFIAGRDATYISELARKNCESSNLISMKVFVLMKLGLIH